MTKKTKSNKVHKRHPVRPPRATVPFIGPWGGPFAIAVTGLVMMYLSWQKWPDVLVDFGRELYVPWQLSRGKSLYTDITYFNGPLSPYLNSLWFRLFGVSVRTLVLCNIAILSCIVLLLYRLLSDISDRLSATVACLVFFAIFAFGHIVGIGNYNFICPYSHELTHGIALSLVALFYLSKYCNNNRQGHLLASGFALGCAFLTKAEVFLAVALAMTVGVGLTIWAERSPWKRKIQALILLCASAAVPPILAFALLLLTMPGGQALTGTLGSWPAVFHTDVASLRFYSLVMGTSDVAANVKMMGIWLGWYAIVFTPLAAVSLAFRKSEMHRHWVQPAAFAVTLAALLWKRDSISWEDAFRPLPLVLLLLGVFYLSALLRRPDRQASAPIILQLVLISFAFALLGKMILNVHVYHYGFALAMPATLLLAVALVGWVPGYITKQGGDGGIFRAIALAMLLVTAMVHALYSEGWFRRKGYPVSSGADAILADERGTFVQPALDEIGRNLGTGQTLAIFPEGVMLNYLSRRVNPTPYINFMPPELIIYGEDRILASLRVHPPDYIALVHKDTSEYGFNFFGRDYGQRIYSWILENYRQVKLIGDPPLQDNKFGILLLRRASAS